MSMAILKLNATQSMIIIDNDQLERLINQLGLLSTSTMTDDELVEFVAFKRQIREHLQPLEAAKSQVLSDPMVNSPLS